ncbi:4-diphosphocytidyl-2-C-methyl-D-erythritol kinase [Marinibacterium anthonyi]|nr:4-diphosphocytidyl-2-C-methyl-D-erythritol kinase [Marinibacterium anthonyi]
MTKAEVQVFAPAKVNLTLHVTGRRDDGYHLLDSLVVFADVGDTITVTPADALSLAIDGPEAGSLAADVVARDDNLVLRAARFLDPGRGAAITLTKRLPVASGIGGGSADAAATLRALSTLWDVPLPAPEATAPLGADVPVCLRGGPVRMQGIGAHLTPLPPLPPLDILLVNPRIATSTGAVFRGMGSCINPPMTDMPPSDLPGLAAWLKHQRNDLAPAAMAATFEIADLLATLETLAPLHSAMSGSGATCFALFPRDGSAAAAQDAIRASHPHWWSAHAAVL